VCYGKAPADEQQDRRALLTAHREQLRNWAEIYSPTFVERPRSPGSRAGNSRPGFDTFAYFQNAKQCYLRWGANAKVRQLDRLHPHLAAAEGNRQTVTIGSPVQQLDIASVVKASQAVSGEIEFGHIRG
jgi:hypothetical protein